jgi:hypothetical protein
VDTSTRSGSRSEPWATLSYACHRVPSGEHTIHINPGTYTDNNQCVLGIGVDIQGTGKDRVTIHSSYSGAYIHASSNRLSTGNHEISGFTIQGGSSPLNRRLNLGIWIKNRSSVSIRDMRFRNIECPAESTQAGAIEIENETPDSVCKAPRDWLTGIQIYNCEFYDCARHKDGNNNSGAVHVYGISGLEIYGCVFDESNTDGQCIKSVDSGGYLKRAKIHDNSFTVADSSIVRPEPLVVEFWGMSEDSEIYKNAFYNGYLSFTNGAKLNGAWSLMFHDNVVENGGMHEFSLDNVDIHNNYFTRYFEPRDWGGGGGIALWGTRCDADADIENWRVRNNVFYDVLDHAIYIQEDVEGIDTFYNRVHIYNNVIDTVGKSGHGIVMVVNKSGSIYTGFEIRNNIIMNCGGHGVLATGATTHGINHIQLTHNLFQGNKRNWSIHGTTNPKISNNFVERPHIEGSGHRPRPYYEARGASSNIVDSGTYVGLYYKGSAPDIGAMEYGEGNE